VSIAGGRRKLVVAVGLFAAGVAAYGALGPTNERAGITGERSRPLMLSREALAAELGAPAESVVQSSPPVDVNAIERGAAHLPVGEVPLPDDRLVQSWMRRDTGQVITQAVLVYDDATRAERLSGLAERLLPAAFSLSARPTTVVGGEEALAWSGPGYEAVSFRRGGYVVFVGMDGADVSGVHRLAEAIARLEPPPPATATP
jgi:hypothetical protein